MWLVVHEVEVCYSLVFGARICSGNFLLHFIHAEAARAHESHAESVLKTSVELESPFFGTAHALIMRNLCFL